MLDSCTACENSNVFYTTKAVDAQNPLGVNLKKGWHSPPEFPIMVRIQFYKVVFNFLDKKLHKHLGLIQLPFLFDETLAFYSSKFPEGIVMNEILTEKQLFETYIHKYNEYTDSIYKS